MKRPGSIVSPYKSRGRPCAEDDRIEVTGPKLAFEECAANGGFRSAETDRDEHARFPIFAPELRIEATIENPDFGLDHVRVPAR